MEVHQGKGVRLPKVVIICLSSLFFLFPFVYSNFLILFSIIRGLCCPHHDTTQSNGLPRCDDFDAMLLRRKDEVGVGIDDQAAIVVEGDQWRVISTDGKAGVVVKRVKVEGDKEPVISSTQYKSGSGPMPLAWLYGEEVVKDKKRKRDN